MKLLSMTGFGKGEAIGTHYTLSVELKSVNNRFKDFRFRIPSLLNSKEIEVKRALEDRFKRGSFDISISYKTQVDSDPSVDVDLAKVNAYLKRIGPVVEQNKMSLSINPVDFMKPQFQIEQDNEEKQSELGSLLGRALLTALDELEESRTEEGEKLLGKLNMHLEAYIKSYNQVSSVKDGFKVQMSEKIRQKFKEEFVDIPMDEQRIGQEIIFYLERMDIDEEINRISIHLQKLKEVLNNSSEVGRKIDFLVQELNRETNTIGSKSADPHISDCVVEMKVQLEKIKEQGLNVE